MVSLKFFTEEDLPEVDYTLDEIQSQYTSTAEYALNRIAERNTGLEFPVIIVNDEKIALFIYQTGNAGQRNREGGNAGNRSFCA
jgi:hypothetical protein